MQKIEIEQLPYAQQTAVKKEVKKHIKYENRFYTIFGIITMLFIIPHVYIWTTGFITSGIGSFKTDIFTELIHLLMFGLPALITIMLALGLPYIFYKTIKKQRINDFFIVHGYLSKVKMITYHGRNSSDVKIYYIIDNEEIEMFQGPTKGLKGPNEKTDVYKYYLVRSSDNCIRRDITEIFN